MVEEYSQHFPDWVARFSRFSLPDSRFLVINGVFWLLMVGAVSAVRARASLLWLAVTLATILGVNAVLHLAGSLVTQSYSPGSVTAAVLYLPLAAYAFRQTLPRIAPGLALRAVVLGATIHAAAMVVAAMASQTR